MTDKYVLWGSSGQAKVLNALIERQGGRTIALFDNNPAAVTAVRDVPLFIGKSGFEAWIKTVVASEYYGLAAIGGYRGRDRIEILHLFEVAGIRVATLVHENACVCRSVRIGRGVQILAHATVGTETKIGNACIINHAATVDHECCLHDGVHIAPGATLCGSVTIGQNAFIGAGAVILPRLNIGADSIVGAGAVVTRDVSANSIVTGNPARPMPIVRNGA